MDKLKEDSLRNDRELHIIWAEVLELLHKELQGLTFKLWIDPIKPLRMSGDQVLATVPDDTTFVTVKQRYASTIEAAFKKVMGKTIHMEFELESNARAAVGDGKNNDAYLTRISSSNLQTKYIFDKFVKGNGNEMAFAASYAVAEAPGQTTYNPLFLYGGVGLGKTHLMHSIGNHVLLRNPAANVLYTSAENLMNEFITSLRERKNQEFRDKYRSIDVLLVDDIQFLSDKEGTQAEFFHTFNALYNDNKQIVISSDKPPSEMKTLEERLSSRFGMGLTVDITLPDFETRTAILEKKAEIDNIHIPNHVIQYIAKNISSNIRELEGALNKVSAYSRLTGQDISMELTEKALSGMLSQAEKREITIERIQEITAKALGFSIEELCSKKKTKDIVHCRHIAMYLCHKLMDLPLLKIGNSFGGRDHTTVIHACTKISTELDLNPSLREIVLKLEQEIKS